MCGGPKTVTSTTNSEPPAYLAGPLRTAANAATNAFQGGSYGGGYNTGRPAGQPISASQAELAQLFGGALNQTFDPGYTPSTDLRRTFGNVMPAGPHSQTGGGASGSGGQGIVGQSQNLIQNTLAGNFLHPESNPYLQQTFNRAADLTRTRLDSEFAGSGRNLGAAMPARSEELQTLASNLFGPNYTAERDRQINAIGQGQDLDPLNLFIRRLAGITPGAGGISSSSVPYFPTGLLG